MILIVSSSGDVHARCVASELTRLGRPFCILDIKSFGNSAMFTYPVNGCASIKLSHKYIIKKDEVEAVWMRRPSQIEVTNVLDEDQSFVKREWADTFTGFLLSLNARFVNPITSQMMAVKSYQLEVANRVGLRTPHTCITNDPEEAKKFAQSFNGRVVHKAISAPPHRFLHTMRWLETDPRTLTDLPIAPTIFQNEIFGVSDVRVTVVGNHIFAARLNTSQGDTEVDSRVGLNICYEQHQLPEHVRELILTFMQELGLIFGTIDLKITDTGEYVFFEVNPQGQFLYVEILTGMPITEAVARLLAGSTI